MSVFPLLCEGLVDAAETSTLKKARGGSKPLEEKVAKILRDDLFMLTAAQVDDRTCCVSSSCWLVSASRKQNPRESPTSSYNEIGDASALHLTFAMNDVLQKQTVLLVPRRSTQTDEVLAQIFRGSRILKQSCNFVCQIFATGSFSTIRGLILCRPSDLTRVTLTASCSRATVLYPRVSNQRNSHPTAVGSETAIDTGSLLNTILCSRPLYSIVWCVSNNMSCLFRT